MSSKDRNSITGRLITDMKRSMNKHVDRYTRYKLIRNRRRKKLKMLVSKKHCRPLEVKAPINKNKTKSKKKKRGFST